MISSLRGTVLRASGTACVIEVGGVGFSLQVTPGHSRTLNVGEQALILTTLIVREDSLSLYGFATDEHLAVFELLTGVSGVGPKSAMGVLAVLEPAEIARAVEAEDDAVFRKVSGIGPKTAKLIVVQLSGKLQGVVTASAQSPSGAETSLTESVIVALVGLGWSERIAAETLREIAADTRDSDATSMPALLRLALARLGPGEAHSRNST